MSLPLRSIEYRKSVASSSDMLPTLTAAFLMAAFTATGILFEDLAKASSVNEKLIRPFAEGIITLRYTPIRLSSQPHPKYALRLVR